MNIAYEPTIIGFLCNWCAYRGADLAGTSRMKYPPNLRAVRVPCSGRVAPELMLHAFRAGADGVLVLGCHLGDCHYQEGNYRMVRRVQVLQRLIGYAGIEPQRLHADFVSAAEAERFTRIVRDFTETIRVLPPIRSRLSNGRLPGLITTVSPNDSATQPFDSPQGRHAIRNAQCAMRDQEDPRWTALREAVSATLPKVDGVLALRSAHGDVAPHLFQSRDELDNLALWPRYPLPDVVRRLYESHPTARLAVVCRACEERGLVEMAKHHQVDWERLTLIGLACSREEVEACRCAWPVPTHARQVVGEPTAGVAADPVLDALPETLEDRLAFWRYWAERCIKCYACRDVCPQCFCHACALEDNLWVERGQVPPPYPMFHLIKAMHMAGKCVACRECETACPAEIPLTIFYRLVNRDVDELFDYRAGFDLEGVPPLLLGLEEENPAVAGL